MDLMKAKRIDLGLTLLSDVAKRDECYTYEEITVNCQSTVKITVMSALPSHRHGHICMAVEVSVAGDA